MINARISLHAKRNEHIREVAREAGEVNSAWIARALGDDPSPRILLAGGTSLVDFRVRVAQSHVRADLLPSFWSRAALLLPGPTPTIWQASLAAPALAAVPRTNGVAEASLAEYDDPARFPNLALLRFPGASAATVREAVSVLRGSRLVEDLVTPLCAWIAYVVGAKGAQNPLLGGTPLPEALFVDAAFAYASVDLVPGVSSRAACPEAIWQAALWWAGYYGGDDVREETVPGGSFVIAQPSAHVVDG